MFSNPRSGRRRGALEGDRLVIDKAVVMRRADGHVRRGVPRQGRGLRGAAISAPTSRGAILEVLWAMSSPTSQLRVMSTSACQMLRGLLAEIGRPQDCGVGQGAVKAETLPLGNRIVIPLRAVAPSTLRTIAAAKSPAMKRACSFRMPVQPLGRCRVGSDRWCSVGPHRNLIIVEGAELRR